MENQSRNQHTPQHFLPDKVYAVEAVEKTLRASEWSSYETSVSAWILNPVADAGTLGSACNGRNF
jgi:hypothetical protein